MGRIASELLVERPIDWGVDIGILVEKPGEVDHRQHAVSRQDLRAQGVTR